MGSENVLSIQGVTASWGDDVVLKDISLSIKSGEVVCLTGPNGSGKSTLLTLLAGIKSSDLKVAFSSDEKNDDVCNGKNNFNKSNCGVFFNDKDISKLNRKEIAKHISYLVQNETSSWNYKVKDVVLTGRFCHTNASGNYSADDYKIADDVMKKLGIEPLSERNVFSLSGGEFQKVRIARSLAQEADFLLLDEPVANLDFGYEAELLNTIRTFAHKGRIFSDMVKTLQQSQCMGGTGVLVSIHDLNTAARFADRIVLLSKISSKGEQVVVSGRVEDVLVPEVLEKVYGSKFGTFIHPEYGCVQVFVRNN